MSVRLLDSKGFNLFLFILVSSVALLVLVLSPLSFLLHRHYMHPLGMMPAKRRWRIAIRLVVLLEFAHILCWLALLANGQPLFDVTLDPTLRSIQVLGWLATLGTPLILYAVARIVALARRVGAFPPGQCRHRAQRHQLFLVLFHCHLPHFRLLY